MSHEQFDCEVTSQQYEMDQSSRSIRTVGLPSLYTIADQYLQDVAKLQDLDLDPQTVADTLEGLSGDLEVKATNVAMFVRNLESLADQIKQAEDTMEKRRKAIEARAESIREYLLANMQRTGISKIDSPYLHIALRKGPPAVVIDDVSLIPYRYMRQPQTPPPAPDKMEIAEALKFGEKVPGAHLESRQTVIIK